MSATAGVGIGKTAGTAAGKTGLSSLLAGPAAPIVLGAGIALPLVLSQFGKGRKKASEWTAAIQDPFGERIKALFDPITEARKAGTLTREQASSALDKFNFEVADLTQAQKEFEALGGEHRQVIAQSRKTLDPLISQWGADLQAHLDSLGAPPPEPTIAPESAPTSTSILAGEGTTPLRKAMGAAEQQRKRAMGGGRQTTIMAGNLPLGNIGRKRTLLGF